MTPPLQTKRPTFDAIPPTAHHSEDWAQHHRKDFRGAHSHGYVDTMNDQKLQFFTMSVFNKHDVDQSGIFLSPYLRILKPDVTWYFLHLIYSKT